MPPTEPSVHDITASNSNDLPNIDPGFAPEVVVVGRGVVVASGPAGLRRAPHRLVWSGLAFARGNLL